MNAHSVRHDWFPSAIPKRKYEGGFDGSEWPLVSEPRPAKRIRHLEGGLSRLTLKAKNPDEPIVISDPEFLLSSTPTPTDQIQDISLDRGVEPSSYEYASQLTGFGGSPSPPLRGEVSEVTTSDEEYGMKGGMEDGRMGGGFVQREGTPGYTVYEPESGPEKIREAGDEECDSEMRGRSWYEPEKDRIVVLDLDGSDDESVTHSPRRRSQRTPTRRRSTEAQNEPPELVINSTLMSHISSSGTASSIPKDDNPGMALVLYKPAPWATAAPEEDEPEITDIEDAVGSGPASMDASPLLQDEDYDDDAMDIDS